MHRSILFYSSLLLVGPLLANQPAAVNPTINHAPLAQPSAKLAPDNCYPPNQPQPALQNVAFGSRFRKPLTSAMMVRKSLIKEIALSLLTGGIYTIFWAVELKRDLNRLGANIPTAWLMIFPFINIYFWCQFIEGYRWVMYGKTDETISLLGGFLTALFPSGNLIALLTMQSEINERLEQLLYQPLTHDQRCA